jgi:hypothetical protein
MSELMEAINTTPTRSLADCVVKLKLLADPNIGIEAGDRPDDVPSLRQVIDFIEGIF